jgi:hypothetical protein
MALLFSPLGLWACAAILCATTPDPDFQGYWRRDSHPAHPKDRGSLLIAVAYRPWAVLRCRLRVEGATVSLWWCA